MKKFIAITLAAVLVLGLLSACGGEKKPTLKVAMSPDFAPMEFVDASKSGQDQFVGFDVTLAKYLAAEMGLELEIVPMSFDACQTAVAMGQVDMAISGFSWMPDRAEKYNLSNTYHAGGPELPSTGSAARLLYVLCGSGIMLGTLVYGIGARRKRERRNE